MCFRCCWVMILSFSGSLTQTQFREGYVLVIKQGQSLPSLSHTHTQTQTPWGERSRPGVVSDCHSSVTLAARTNLSARHVDRLKTCTCCKAICTKHTCLLINKKWNMCCVTWKRNEVFEWVPVSCQQHFMLYHRIRILIVFCVCVCVWIC